MNLHAPRLCIAGGGTGGHVMPALALAQAARTRWPELEVHFIGAERGLEARLLPERGEEALLLAMHAIQGAGLLQRLRVLFWELPRAVLQVRRYWRRSRNPDLVVGVGGYASITGVAAAILNRIPVVLYEQNAVPGMVNRQLARFCKKVMLGFAEAAEHLPRADCVITGNIVRESIQTVRRHAHTPPRLLVLGGSQGAQFLNETVPQACALLKARGYDFAVTHQCGGDDLRRTAVTETYQKSGVAAEVLTFCDDMAAFYDAGDMMIARAGAMTVGEAALCGMPTLFVPLPHAADRHQFFNARTLADKGAALIVEQHASSAESLAAELERHLFDEATLQQMSRRACDTALRDAESRQLGVLAELLPVSMTQ